MAARSKDAFALTRLISQSFRKHGLTLKADASKALHEYVSSVTEKDQTVQAEALVAELVVMIKEKQLKQKHVTLDLVQAAVSQLEKQSKRKAGTNLVLTLDAFDQPRFQFESVSKTFRPVPDQGSRHGEAKEKAMMFRGRFEALKQQLLRNDVFSPPPMSAGPASRKDYYAITDIESLVGAPGRKCVFGMLTSLREGQYHLEDLVSSIPVDLSNARLTSGLFVDGAFVLCEGELEDGVFVVQTMGFPPPETRKDTLSTFPLLDFCGMDMKGLDKEKERARLTALLAQRKNDMVVILAQVHLDRPQVMEKLRVLFQGMEPACPPLFVFMGNFTSQPFGISAGDRRAYQGYMDGLADLIAEFPSLNKSSRFLLVPGPTDPGVGNVLPRPKLADLWTQRLRDKVERLELGSNPCRVLYLGQEILFFREDLLHKMRRNCLLAPSEDETDDLAEHLVKTVVDQSHLCPLPPVVRPVYWNYDHSLRLYPLPDLLVLGDVVDQYEVPYEGCQAVNPGTFSSDFSFVIYYPSSSKLEFSRID
eukprot:gb/GEZN01005560.1/.p1 GENE.gb/GEZN01005560.1/~~gb/GEZN01005560.1/.p1  ORF type:complete len:534 (-),score=90.17 gb/GEZN01005560.1/:109-1710(-)